MKVSKLIFCASLVLTGFSMANANLLVNGDLDKTFADPNPPNLPKPQNWSASGHRPTAGDVNDMLSSESWAGPAPTPVTTDGANGDDWGVFFKAFIGTSDDPITSHLWQDVAGTAGNVYTLDGWAGGEANHLAESHWFSLIFLDANMTVIGSAGLQLDSTLLVDNGLTFRYKEYSVSATAPTGTAFVRSDVAMINGSNNPLGGGQAFVVDDFTLTSEAVPEPATMSVLGIGALVALARKRKASK